MAAKGTPGLRIVVAVLAATLVTLGLPGGTAVAAPPRPRARGWRGSTAGAGMLGAGRRGLLAHARRPKQVTSAMPVISMGHSYCDVRGHHPAADPFRDQAAGHQMARGVPRTSEHSLSRLGKAVITRYYGRPPTSSRRSTPP